MKEVYIVSVARTAVGGFGGSLLGFSAVQLGAHVIKEAIKRAGVEASVIEDVYMGNVIQANVGQAPATQAAIAAGISYHTPSTTINKVCASGMKSVMIGAQTILLGENDVVMTGGMESMSNVPYYLGNARFGYRLGDNKLLDGILRDGLQDPYKDYHMGNCAEICAAKYHFSREEQDAYAEQSYRRAIAAHDAGKFNEEIVEVLIPQKKGESISYKRDEDIDKVDFAKLSTLRPVFLKDGTVTAANASNINDGAAALLIMSGEKVKELGLTPLARIVSFADAQQEPEMFTTTPSLAMPKAVKKAGLSFKEIDYIEINEAFSVVALANIKEMELDPARVNIYGGAVSIGHPVGVSGARIIMTLLSALRNENGRYGCAGICNGGGGASAMVIERL